MRVLTLPEVKHALQIKERPGLEPGEGEVVVRLHAAALNRRDFWITQGMYPGIKTPVVLGSDGAGVVARVGAGSHDRWVDQNVVINPGWEWGTDEAVQCGQFRILGMPDDGTFATEIVVPEKYLHPKPEHLSWTEAAALPLAAVTAYRALFTQGQLASGESVLISGIGGGVAMFALQFALAAGAKTFVTSSSAKKIQRAVEMGATAGFNYGTEDWHTQLTSEHGGVNLIIDGACGDGYGTLVDLAVPGGRIVHYGATAGPPSTIDLFSVFWKQLRLIGSTMGSPGDFQAMLGMVNARQITPVVDQVYPLAEGNQALQRMAESQQLGKLVLDTLV